MKVFYQVVKDLRLWNPLLFLMEATRRQKDQEIKTGQMTLERTTSGWPFSWNLKESLRVFKKWKCLRPSVILAHIIEVMCPPKPEQQVRRVGDDWQQAALTVNSNLPAPRPSHHHPVYSGSSFQGSWKPWRWETCGVVTISLLCVLALLSIVVGSCIFYWRQLGGSECGGLRWGTSC